MEIVSCKLCSHYICRTIFDKDIEPFCALGYPLEPCPDFEEENHKMYTSLVEDNEALNKRVGELEARVAELERVLQEIVEVDPETQIGGVSSYLYAWEQCHTIARAALGEKDNGNV